MSWIDRWYGLIDSGESEAAADLLYESVDDLFRAGAFSEFEAQIASVDLDRLDVDSLVGLLCSSWCARDEIDHGAIMSRVEPKIVAMVPGRADALLRGLR